MKEQDTSRRHFLAGAAALSGLALAAGLVSSPAVAYAKQAAAKKKMLDSYIPQFFTIPEWRFLLAACDRLIPSDETGPGALEAGVPVFIDRQMLTEYGTGGLWYMHGPFYEDSAPEFGYQMKFSPREIYRVGIAEVMTFSNTKHGKDFHELGPDVQDSILKSLESGDSNLDVMPPKIFFAQLLSNTREGYLADPMYGGNRGMGGWKMVGFPGARGDYHEFVRQHNKPYPNAPVSIRRRPEEGRVEHG